jgi:hypothetical protein
MKMLQGVLRRPSALFHCDATTLDESQEEIGEIGERIGRDCLLVELGLELRHVFDETRSTGSLHPPPDAATSAHLGAFLMGEEFEPYRSEHPEPLVLIFDRFGGIDDHLTALGAVTDRRYEETALALQKIGFFVSKPTSLAASVTAMEAVLSATESARARYERERRPEQCRDEVSWHRTLTGLLGLFLRERRTET